MDAGVPVALVGCGYIADRYVESIRRYPALRLAGVTDRDAERARRFGAFHRVRVFPDLDALLAAQDVRIVLNLTNPRSHYEVSRACLEAGKHVYSEKPLAMTLSDARALVDLAAARGLRISGAPCNLLGECAQTIWRSLRTGRLGRVRAVYAEMDDGLLHRMPFRKWRNDSGSPWPYRDEFEVGCTLEHAGYSVGLLTAFFGPVRSLTALSSLQIADKDPDPPEYPFAPDLSVAVMQHESGVVSRLTCTIIAPHDHSLRIFGDEGVLYTPDVWRYDAPVYRRRWLTIRRRMLLAPWRERPPRCAEHGRKPSVDDRARGVAELAASIAENRPSRLSPEFVLHITEVALAIQNAGAAGVTSRMTTRFDPVRPMPWGE